MDPKILFIDVDGTLVDYTGKVPASADLAIKEARKNGHKVYICTGRSEAEVYPEIWACGLDGMIGANGGYIKDGDEVLFHQSLSKEEEAKIVKWLEDRGIEFYLESNDGLFASREFETKGVPFIQAYSARKGKPADITMRQAFPTMIFDGELIRDGVNKISYLLEDYNDYLEAKKAFADLQHGTWGGAGETALFGDVGVPAVSKLDSIQMLLDHLGAKKEDTIAFGDAKIDIPMLEFCDIGVAMGSGGEEIRKMADLVTTDTDDDGLYNAFVKLGLIEDVKNDVK